MHKASTLVLVLATHARPYPSLVRTIKRTWAPVSVPGIETLFYFGGRELRLDGHDLHLPLPDDLAHTGRKTLACLEWVLRNRDAGLVFRTNCSSYVDLPNLDAFVRTHVHERDFYGGKVGMAGDIPFASGSGYFLSRDLVELVVERQGEWDHSVLDDVALGSLLRGHGIEIHPAPRQDLTSLADIRKLDLSQFHFRCKAAAGRRRNDALIMVAAHRAFCRSRGVRCRSLALALPVVSRGARRAARGAVSVARSSGPRGGRRSKPPS